MTAFCAVCKTPLAFHSAPLPFTLTLTARPPGWNGEGEVAFFCAVCVLPLQDYLREKGILK